MSSLVTDTRGSKTQGHVGQAIYLASLLDHLSVAVVSTDPDFRILSWNAAAQLLYGRRSEDVLGRAYEETVQSDYQQLSCEAVRRVALALGEWSGEVWQVHQTGARFPVTMSIRALPGSKNEIAGFVITSQKVPERQPRPPVSTDDRYQLFFDEAPIMNVVTELCEGDLYVRQCNQMFLASLGYDQSHVLGKPLRNFYSAASRQRLDARLNMISQGQTVAEEREFITSDGHVIAALMKSVVIQSADGRVLGTVSSFVDVSDQKLVEARLRKSEEKLQALLASLDDIVFEVDEDGVLLDLWISDAALLFMPREQTLGRSLLEIFGEETSRPFYNMLRQVLETDTSMMLEYSLDLPVGLRWFSARYNPIKSKTTDRRRISILVRDITQRKQIEIKQELSDEILNSLSDFVLVSNGLGEIVYVTPAIENMLGYPPDEILGEGWWNVGRGTPDDLAAERLYVQKAARGEVSVDEGVYEHLFRTRDGSFRWLTMRDVKGPRDLLIGVGHDITERKLAEEQVREANDKFIELANNIPDIFWSENPLTGKSLFLSPAFERITGRVPEELETLPDEFLSLVLPEDQAIIQEARKLESAGQTTDIRYRIRHVDGSIRWIHDKGVPIFDATGKVIRVVGVGSDVTEQIVAEDLLKESEARFRQLAENIKEVFWMFDNSVGRTIYVSPAYETIWGRPCESLYQNESDYLEAVLPDDREILRFAAANQQAGLPTEVEYRIQRPDGTLRWVWDRSFPVFDDAGVLARTIGVVSDVTDVRSVRHELETLNQELEQRVRSRTAELGVSSRRLSLATEAARLGVWELDLAHNRLLWDRQMYEIYGRSPDTFEVTFENFANIVVPDDLPVLMSFLEMAMHGDVSTRVDYRIIHSDGSIRNVQAHGVIVRDDAGQVLQLVGVVQDVTQEKQAELALRQNEEHLRLANSDLARANRAKDEFLATMSHELRTPLTSILGLTESLLLQTYGALSQKHEKVLKSIAMSGNHLLDLINDVLDLTKINAGKGEIYPETVDLNTVCNESLAFIQPQARAKSIKVVYSPAMNAEKIIADPRRLKQILCNLLGNAVKFTPENGRINLAVRADPQQALIRFMVTDSGIGISAENQQRIFTPFFQVDSQLNRHFEGTGLGLAMVLRLAELHGGTVALVSEVGKGSSFTVTLPWSPELAPVQEEALETSQTTPPSMPVDKSLGLILLVDDTAASVMTIMDYLEYRGYTMLTAGNGPDGIAKAQENLPDLILMDIQMPGMDGMDVIRRLRSDPRFKTTPIIAITALAMAGDRERILAAGADDYISKPVSLKQLADQIRVLLDR